MSLSLHLLQSIIPNIDYLYFSGLLKHFFSCVLCPKNLKFKSCLIIWFYGGY